ncbi:MAG: hypothetical protein GC134_06910 [Proteobacteria bacterium]|nr:hypothetical protein [Pseudomonadota bacterium]
MNTVLRTVSTDALSRLHTLHKDSTRDPNGPSMAAFYRMLLLTGATPTVTETIYHANGMGAVVHVIYAVADASGTVHEFPVAVGSKPDLQAEPTKWGTAERVPFQPAF